MGITGIRQSLRLVCLFGLLTFASTGCIGTDLIDDIPFAEPRIVVSPETDALQIGEMLQFSATYYDGFENEVAEAAVDWVSADVSVATISSDGIATAVGSGTTQIMAVFEQTTSSPSVLNVVADPTQVATIRIDGDDRTIQKGLTENLSARAFNLSGEEIPNVTISWASDNTDVATVSADGLVTAVESGGANITASASGVSSVPIRITVPGSSRSGRFTARQGTSYTVRGGVTVREKDTGGLIVEFADDFGTSNGPDIQVVISATENFTPNSISLGVVKSTSRAQSYDVPAGVALADVNWILIHCVSFNVTFGQAEMNQ